MADIGSVSQIVILNQRIMFPLILILDNTLTCDTDNCTKQLLEMLAYISSGNSRTLKVCVCGGYLGGVCRGGGQIQAASLFSYYTTIVYTT